MFGSSKSAYTYIHARTRVYVCVRASSCSQESYTAPLMLELSFVSYLSAAACYIFLVLVLSKQSTLLLVTLTTFSQRRNLFKVMCEESWEHHTNQFFPSNADLRYWPCTDLVTAVSAAKLEWTVETHTLRLIRDKWVTTGKPVTGCRET